MTSPRFSIFASITLVVLFAFPPAVSAVCCGCKTTKAPTQNICIQTTKTCASLITGTTNPDIKALADCSTTMEPSACKPVSDGLCVIGPVDENRYTAGADAPTASTDKGVPFDLKLNIPIPGIAFADTVIQKGDYIIAPQLSQYIAGVERYMIGMAVTAAAVMIVYGGFLYIMTAAGTNLKRSGKEVIKDAAIGLILVLGCVTLLATINPNLVSPTTLKIRSVQQSILKLGKESTLLKGDFCNGISPDKSLLFSEVSNGTGDIKSIPAEQTKCGSAYVNQSISGTCLGQSCNDNGGTQCINCEALPPETRNKLKICEGKKSTCMKGIFFGTVSYTDGRWPYAVKPMLVCTGAVGTYSDMSTMKKNFLVSPLMLANENDGYHASTAPQEGTLIYHWDPAANPEVMGIPSGSQQFQYPNFEKIAKDYCNSVGGQVLGIALSVGYNAERDNNGAFNGGGDVIVLKKDCGKGVLLSGNGDDAVSAFICSAHFISKKGTSGLADSQISHLTATASILRDPSAYWTLDDIKLAGIAHIPLACDINLNRINAPIQPDLDIYAKKCNVGGFAD